MTDRAGAAVALPLDRPAKARAALIAIGVCFLAYNTRLLLFQFDAFAVFYRTHPWQVGETVWKTAWIVLAIAAVMVTHGLGVFRAARELGLWQPMHIGLGAALVATLPFAALGAASSVNPSLALLPIWMTAVVSPISEEVLFRGYLFRQLYQRAGWPFWAAIAMNAVPFAWGHIGRADEAAMVFVITGVGAALASWLLIRWEYDLWFVIGLHSFVNLWWYVFAVGETAIGGWAGNVARLLTFALAILITLQRPRFLMWLGHRSLEATDGSTVRQE